MQTICEPEKCSRSSHTSRLTEKVRLLSPRRSCDTGLGCYDRSRYGDFHRSYELCALWRDHLMASTTSLTLIIMPSTCEIPPARMGISLPTLVKPRTCVAWHGHLIATTLSLPARIRQCRPCSAMLACHPNRVEA